MFHQCTRSFSFMRRRTACDRDLNAAAHEHVHAMVHRGLLGLGCAAAGAASQYSEGEEAASRDELARAERRGERG